MKRYFMDIKEYRASGMLEGRGLYLVPLGETDFQWFAEDLFFSVCDDYGARLPVVPRGVVEVYEFDDSDLHFENEQWEYIELATHLAERAVRSKDAYVDWDRSVWVATFYFNC